jgi:hypothetical protein
MRQCDQPKYLHICNTFEWTTKGKVMAKQLLWSVYTRIYV